MMPSKGYIKLGSILIALILLSGCALLDFSIPVGNTANLVPFPRTGDLFLLDDGCDCMLRINQAGEVQIEISREEIRSLVGDHGNIRDNAAVFDAAGTMYFTVEHNLLKKHPGQPVEVLTLDSAFLRIGGQDPDGLTFGSDGFLYVVDDIGEHVLKVNPNTGSVEMFVSKSDFEALEGIDEAELERGIVGTEAAKIYVLSRGEPNAIFEISLADRTASVFLSGKQFFDDISQFMTRSANGDFLVIDDDDDEVLRVSPQGVVSLFLSKSQLRHANCVGESVNMDGGIAFDSDGNFYIAETATASIYRFDTNKQCELFVSSFDIQSITGVAPRLSGGIAFAPR